jgi:hypothetical protein
MDQDVKQKDEILKEVFADFKNKGLVPWINDKSSDDKSITVDGICIHGKCLESREIKRDEDSNSWTWEDGVEPDSFCMGCNPDCDCGKPHQQRCPICKALWPKFSEERLIQAWKNDEDLEHETLCPKCGHAWSLTIEEMKRLHPEVEGPFDDGSYRELNVSLSDQKADRIPPQGRPIRNGRPIGRNSECPCGSGKKYKRCCETGSPKK